MEEEEIPPAFRLIGSQWELEDVEYQVVIQKHHTVETHCDSEEVECSPFTTLLSLFQSSPKSATSNNSNFTVSSCSPSQDVDESFRPYVAEESMVDLTSSDDEAEQSCGNPCKEM